MNSEFVRPAYHSDRRYHRISIESDSGMNNPPFSVGFVLQLLPFSILTPAGQHLSKTLQNNGKSTYLAGDANGLAVAAGNPGRVYRLDRHP